MKSCCENPPAEKTTKIFSASTQEYLPHRDIVHLGPVVVVAVVPVQGVQKHLCA